MVRESRPGGGAIFRTCPYRPWDPPSLLYNLYRASLPRVKRPERGVDHPPPSSVEVKERIELYFYSPSGASLPVIGWTLTFTAPHFKTVVPLQITGYCHKNFERCSDYDYPGTVTKTAKCGRDYQWNIWKLKKTPCIISLFIARRIQSWASWWFPAPRL
jgi:hypothetical protein